MRTGPLAGPRAERSAALACAAALCLFASPSRGDVDTRNNRVHFQVDASREVANDRVRAVVGVTKEDVEPARLADAVNREMAWALEEAGGTEGVDVESGGYHTHPVYEDGRIRRWRASQDLVLESEDVESLTRLVGTLQERLQLRSFEFSVSPEQRRRTEDALIEEALAAFRARAEIVRRSLEFRAYEIGELSIDTQGMAPPPRPTRMRTMALESTPAPPAVEAGTSRLQVSVQGMILLE